MRVPPQTDRLLEFSTAGTPFIMTKTDPRILPQMMKLLSAAFFLVFASMTVFAQDDQWPPLNYLRHDYNSAKVAAHVHVREAEIVNRIIGYEDWRIVCDVIE